MNLNVVGMFSTSALLLGACVALNGCQSHRANKLPAIEFTKIPPAAQGGKEKIDTIAGRVVGARPGQQIVIYARSGAWWVQPTVANPFTPIRTDSTWTTETHLGFEYAAPNGTVGHPLLEGIDYSAIFREPSALEQTFAIFANVVEFDESGHVLMPNTLKNERPSTF